MTIQSALACLLLSTTVAAQGTVPDAWSSKVTFRTIDGWYAAPIHAALLPDGRIHFIGIERDTEDPLAATARRKGAWVMTPDPLFAPLPAEIVIQELVEPMDLNQDTTYMPGSIVDDDLECTGQALTSDGRLLTAGGTRWIREIGTGNVSVLGLSYATIFDGAAWTRVATDMLAVGPLGTTARWYPTVTRLWNGRMLITSGEEQLYPGPYKNRSTEAFDPILGTWQVLSPHGEPPVEIENPDYTHAFVLPEKIGANDLLMLGKFSVPVLYSIDSLPHWTVVPIPRPDSVLGQVPNNGASSTLLPIRADDGDWGYANGSVLVAGGQEGTNHQEGVDAYDPSLQTWLPRVYTGVPRTHPSTVDVEPKHSFSDQLP